jgi:AcrR family transcriptional regulator
VSDHYTKRERILDASRRLFNELGYAGTTLAAIAAEVGITQGHLWYYFRSKLDLVRGLEDQARESGEKLRANARRGTAAEDYAFHLVSRARNSWAYLFLVRDAMLFRRDGVERHRDPEMLADIEGLKALLRRMEKEGLFRRDMKIDLGMLASSLRIAARYWPDHLREIDGIDVIAREDVERGIRHHIALLLPYLTADGRRQLEAAFAEHLTERALEVQA